MLRMAFLMLLGPRRSNMLFFYCCVISRSPVSPLTGGKEGVNKDHVQQSTRLQIQIHFIFSLIFLLTTKITAEVKQFKNTYKIKLFKLDLFTIFLGHHCSVLRNMDQMTSGSARMSGSAVVPALLRFSLFL